MAARCVLMISFVVMSMRTSKSVEFAIGNSVEFDGIGFNSPTSTNA